MELNAYNAITLIRVDMDNGWTIERSVDRASRTKNPFGQRDFDSPSCRIIIGLTVVSILRLLVVDRASSAFDRRFRRFINRFSTVPN